jgi:hypothetical protein
MARFLNMLKPSYHYFTNTFKTLHMKFIVSLGFKKLRQAEQKMFARTVQVKMTNNPYFTTLAAEIEALKVANDALTIAVANADEGNKEQTIIKNNCFAAVLDLLDDLAEKVNAVAKGNELIVISSGFKLNKTPAPITEISVPFYVELTNTTTAGEGYVKWKCDDLGVNNYSVEYQIQGTETWLAAGNASAKELYIKGIPQGSVIVARVRSNGTRNRESEWVNTLPLMIS